MKKILPPLIRILPVWLALAFVITVLSGLVYVTIQQSLRIGANDPQIQVAEDLAASLAQGHSLPSPNAETQKVELTKSLAPFTMVFDSHGQVLFSSAVVAGSVPAIPQGVLDYTQTHGEDRFTWQPQPGVRIAVVVHWYQSDAGGGFVLVGRSLREVENREDQTLLLVGLAWVVSIVGSLVLVAGGTALVETVSPSRG
jgi:hypothetical protein